MTRTLAEVLDALPERLPPRRIDRVWLFRPRRGGGRESGVVVLAVLPVASAGDGTCEGATLSRDVYVLRYLAESERGKVSRHDTLTEEARAPLGRMAAVISGVRRRMEGPNEEKDPREHGIDGDSGRWTSLVERIRAEAELDEASGE